MCEVVDGKAHVASVMCLFIATLKKLSVECQLECAICSWLAVKKCLGTSEMGWHAACTPKLRGVPPQRMLHADFNVSETLQGHAIAAWMTQCLGAQIDHAVL